MGLTAPGHRIKLRDFCAKSKSKLRGNGEDRKEKLDKLHSLIGASHSRSRKGKTPLQSDGPTTKNNDKNKKIFASSLAGSTGLTVDSSKRRCSKEEETDLGTSRGIPPVTIAYRLQKPCSFPMARVRKGKQK